MPLIDKFRPGRVVQKEVRGLAAIRSLAKTPETNQLTGTVERDETIPSRVEPIMEQPPELKEFTAGFLREVEGFRTDVYVPEKDGKVLGQSGPTVASGFDLGQHTAADMKRMGFYDELIRKLKPYAGKKGASAQEFVKNNPIQLSPAEANFVNKKVKQSKYEKIVKEFDEASNGAVWEELPDEWKTAISSVAFQYGDLSSETPNFWKQVTTGDFKGAYRNLRKFGDKYSTRRNREADLVQQVVDWSPKGIETQLASNSGLIVIEEG